MEWQQWVLIGMIAFSVLANIAKIGKPVKPNTPGIAIGIVIFSALEAWLIVSINH